MYYCFLTDGSLNNRVTGMYKESEINSGLGFATEKIESFFVDRATVEDIRDTRLSIGGNISTYQTQLLFDGDKDNGPLNFSNVTDVEKKQLFNIIEALSYRSDLANAAMEAELVGNTASYGAYVAASFQRSAGVTTVSTYTSVEDVSAHQVGVYDYIVVKVTIGGETVELKVWNKEAAFLADYPYTTFVSVIYPGTPAQLLNPTYTNKMDVVATMSRDIYQYMQTHVSSADNSGVIVYESDYYPAPDSDPYSISFGVIYKGPSPSSADTRAFVKTSVLATGLAPEDTWKAILPDLFTDGRYFVIPLYDNVTALPDVSLPIGIGNHKHMRDVAALVFPSYPTAFIDANLEVFGSGASEMILIGLPHIDNPDTFLSIRGEHPTYQATDARGQFFANQEVHTRDFNISLSSVIAQALGGQNDDSFIEDEFSGREYYSFIEHFKEYHVLKSTSYPI